MYSRCAPGSPPEIAHFNNPHIGIRLAETQGTYLGPEGGEGSTKDEEERTTAFSLSKKGRKELGGVKPRVLRRIDLGNSKRV